MRSTRACEVCGRPATDPVVIRVNRLDRPVLRAECCSLGCAGDYVLRLHYEIEDAA